MKNLLLSSMATAAVLMSSCSGMMELKRIDTTQLEQIQDSMLKKQIVPGTRSIHTLQVDDYSTVTIIINNHGLYADKDKIPMNAVRVGEMVLRVLGPDASISRGTFIVVERDDNSTEVPADGISGDMKIDSLKKVMFGK